MSAADIRSSLVVDRPVESTFGYLFGGCALGEAITVLEGLTDRRCLSATARFLRFAAHGAQLDLAGRVVRSGSRVTHAEVVATDGVDEIFVVDASLVPPASDDHRPIAGPPPAALAAPPGQDLLAAKPGATADRVDLRAVEDLPGSGEASWAWAMLRDRPVATAADLAVLADFLPILPYVVGRPLMANTVDMTLRASIDAPTDRVLMEIAVPVAGTTAGHTEARLWSEDGRCLAVTSQSFVIQSWEG